MKSYRGHRKHLNDVLYIVKDAIIVYDNNKNYYYLLIGLNQKACDTIMKIDEMVGSGI